MFWVDSVIDEIKNRYGNKLANKEAIIIRDEKTASGRVHVGSLRGVVVHGAIAKALKQHGIERKFLYEINDFDPMDGLPSYLDKDKYQSHMGKQLFNVPAPDGSSKNFAEFYGEEFKAVIKKLGFDAEFYYTSNLYNSGDFDETIRLALDNRELIRKIYLEVSKSEKSEDWYPFSVVCQSCGKIGTTKVIDWDGEEVTYKCGDFVDWATGCSHEGKISPFGGNGKLPWKVEWAAKFRVLGVDVEGAGKDHSTRGGSRDIANRISREVFDREPPIDVPYEWLNVEGRSMSSSKGVGVSAKEMSDLLPPEILNLLLLQKKPMQAIDFSPDGDSIPNLFDVYDRLAGDYFDGKEDYTSEIFKLIHPDSESHKLEKRFLPRFSQIAYLVQMPHLDIEKEIEKNEDIKLTEKDKEEIRFRAEYARTWLEKFAPEKFKFELQKDLPEATRKFSPKQKEALSKVLDFVNSGKDHTGEDFHKALHDIKADVGIEPKDFFEAIYISILNKLSGPKAGWFLSVLDRDFLIKRLEEVSN